MPKPLTNEELMELIAEGAVIKQTKDDTEKQTGEKFDQIVGQLQAIAESNQAIVAEHQSQMSMMLDKLSSALKEAKVDYEPVFNIIKEMKLMENSERPSYEFKVNRNNRGLIDTVEATPQPTQPRILN